MDTVLLVDDDAELRLLLREGLERSGFTVREAAGGDDALLHLRAGDVGVAIVDLRMAPMNGHELMEHMRRSRIDVPVIVMTGMSTLEDAVQALRNGALDLLEKPFDTDFLVDTVKGALRVRERLDAGDARLIGSTPARSATPVPPPPPPAPRAYTRRPEDSTLLEHVRGRLQEGSLNLPVAHPVLRDVTRIMGNPLRRGTRFLQVIVERDQELALRVVHRANAEPLLAMGPVHNLRQAVDRLGRHTVFSIAIKSVTERMEAGPSDRRRGRLSLQLWRRSVATAAAARILAGAAGDPEPERLYTLALLMDIGEPLLLGVIEEVVKDLPIAPPFVQVRREVGTKHPEFGAALLEGWGMPEEVVEVARRHHDAAWLRAPGRASEEVAAAVHLVTAARYAAQECGIVVDDEEEFDPYPAELDRCLQRCELDQADWRASLESITEALRRAGLSTAGQRASTPNDRLGVAALDEA